MPHRFMRAFVTVSGFTGLSRVLGFVRDQLLGAFIGPGVVLDAWQAAFTLPNVFRRTFAEGAMSAAFVPILKEKLANAGEAEAKAFAQSAFSLLILVLTPLVALMIIFMPHILRVITGFQDGSQALELSVVLGRIMLPYLLLMSAMALIGGILDSLNHFAPKAFAPALLNVILIAVLSAVAWFDLAAAPWLSWATLAAGFAQLAAVWWPAARLGWAPKLKSPRGTGTFLKQMVPGIIARGGFQISSLIVLALASSQVGDLSHLRFADRLYQLPLGLIGIALNTVLLSTLSGLIAQNRESEARIQLNRGLEFSLLLSIPITFACMFHADFLFRGLFEVGRFTALDTQGAAAALVGYALGIPAAVGQTVLQPAFFARQNTRTPMVHSLGSVGVAVVLSYVLYPHFGIFGLALAASIASWVGFLSLASHLVWVRLFQPDQRFFMRLIPMIGASAVMVAALHGGLYMLDDLQAFGFALRLPLSLVLITASAMLYFALIFGLGVFNKSDLQFLRNRS